MPTLGAAANAISIADLIRARSYVKVYRVNPGGGTGIYTTIAAALTQIGTDDVFGAGYDRGPEWRRLVLIDPGTYTEAVNPPDFVDFIGSSGVQTDVAITQSGATATLELGGKTSLVANLTLAQTGTASGGGIYPYHADAQLGALPPAVPQQRIFYNVAFTSTNPNRQQAAGIGIQPRMTEVHVNCTYTPASGGSVLNIHNAPGAQSWRGTLALINPTINGTTADAVFVTDQNTGREDVLVITGNGSITVTGGARQVNIANTLGTTMQYILDPGIVTNYVVSSAASVVNQRALQAGAITGPIIQALQGDSDAIRSWYYPSKIRQPAVLSPLIPDASAQLVTANRLYYVRVPIHAAWNVAKLTQGVGTNAGNLWGGFYLPDSTGKPAGYLSRSSSGSAAAAGLNTLTLFNNRTIYPGYGYVWAAVVCTDGATATLTCSSLLSTIQDAYYEDLTPGFSTLPITATPLALAAGTACPVPSLLAA